MEPEEPQEFDLDAQAEAHILALSDRLQQKSPIYGILMSGIKHTSIIAGCVTSRLPLTAMHVNSKGGLHGAVSAAIIDFTTGLAIASWDFRETTGASVDMHITYLSSSAGVGDEVEIIAKAERVGRNMAFVTIRIEKVDEHGGRTVIALGQHTKFVRGTKVDAKE